MKTVANNKGFSLIELMIVVAIIGILSAVAIPNFQRFQLKAKQSEAKTSLAAIYQAQKAFHQEWGTYFAEFVDIGYSPEGLIIYDTFTGNSGSGMNAPNGFTGYSGTIAAGMAATNTNTDSFCTASAGCTRNTDHLSPNTIVNADSGGAITQTAFLAGAASDIDKASGTADDEWTIDQLKNIQNAVVGF